MIMHYFLVTHKAPRRRLIALPPGVIPKSRTRELEPTLPGGRAQKNAIDKNLKGGFV